MGVGTGIAKNLAVTPGRRGLCPLNSTWPRKVQVLYNQGPGLQQLIYA